MSLVFVLGQAAIPDMNQLVRVLSAEGVVGCGDLQCDVHCRLPSSPPLCLPFC